MFIRILAGALLVFLFTAVSVPPPVPHRYPSVGGLFAPTAQAKSKVRNLLDRVLGKNDARRYRQDQRPHRSHAS